MDEQSLNNDKVDAFVTSVAIVGWSSFGQSLALGLLARGCNVLVIDNNVASVKRLSPEIACIQTDVTDETALRDIEITKYDLVVVAIRSDLERSVMTTAALDRTNVRQIICQASTRQHGVILRRMGAHRTIEPYSEEGYRLALDLIDGPRRQEMDFGQDHEIITTTISAEGAGKSLSSLNLPDLQRVVLLLYRANEVLLSPSGDEILQSGDVAVILTVRERATT